MKHNWTLGLSVAVLLLVACSQETSLGELDAGQQQQGRAGAAGKADDGNPPMPDGGAAGTGIAGSGGSAGTGASAGASGDPDQCSPCRAMNEADCRADLSCEAIPYWGESAAPCVADDRGFATDCPFVGCRASGMKGFCQTLDELNETCAELAPYGSYQISSVGCRVCGTQQGPDERGKSIPECSVTALCTNSPTLSSCSKPECSPCRMLTADACAADSHCEAVPYWGESDVICQYDERGFGNCGTSGCRAAGMAPKCPTEEELDATCPTPAPYGSYQVGADGCRTCGVISGPEQQGSGVTIDHCAFDAYCQMNPSSPLCGCSPCRAMNRDECMAATECEAIPFWGESAVICDFDQRGFSANCPFVGCRPTGVVCPSVEDLDASCQDKAPYGNYAIDNAGCRTCGEGGYTNWPTPFLPCAQTSLCKESPKAEACDRGECSPCRALTVEQCQGAQRCVGIVYWGETDEPCISDELGFGNCTIGCMDAQTSKTCMDAGSIADTCGLVCPYLSYKIGSDGCRTCECGDANNAPVEQCAKDALAGK